MFNVWTAYLNLESTYGSPDTLREVFERAIKNADSLKMHKIMYKIYQKAGKVEVNEAVLNLVIFLLVMISVCFVSVFSGK